MVTDNEIFNASLDGGTVNKDSRIAEAIAKITLLFMLEDTSPLTDDEKKKIITLKRDLDFMFIDKELYLQVMGYLKENHNLRQEYR